MQAKALAIRRTALGLIKPKEPEEEAPATQEEPPQEDPPQESSPKPIVIEDIDHAGSDDSDWGPWTKHGKRQTIVIEDIDHADSDDSD